MTRKRQFDLAGCIIPSNIRLGFLIPYFVSQDDKFVQLLDRDWKIVGFRKLVNDEIDQQVLIPSQKISVRLNDNAIFSYVFNDNTLICGDKPYLIKQFRARTTELSQFPRAYKEVLEFIGDLETSVAVIFQIHQLDRQNNSEIVDAPTRTKIAYLQDKVTRIQLRALESQSVPVKQWNEHLEYADNEGFLNYWNIHNQVEQLIHNYGEVQLRLKLVRSQIGTSPKERNSLKAFGLSGKKIGTVTKPILVNIACRNRLRQVRNHVIVAEVKAYGWNEITIRPLDPVDIQKRYLKKNSKKVVQDTQHQDYVCIVKEMMGESEG